METDQLVLMDQFLKNQEKSAVMMGESLFARMEIALLVQMAPQPRHVQMAVNQSVSTRVSPAVLMAPPH